MASRAGVGIVTGVNVTSTLATLLQLIAAANHRVRLTRFEIFFAGTSSTGEPVEVSLARQSTAGTSSAGTVVPLDDSLAEALLTTALDTFTVEPTTGAILWYGRVHPQSGLIWTPPSDLWIGGGDRLGIRGEAATTVAAEVNMYFEE